MATRMQQRRGTASQWTSLNPVLLAGEIGVETDTGKFKFGNGTSTWTALSYSQSDAGEPLISRSGASSGQVPKLQNDGSLKFAASGGNFVTVTNLFGPEPRNAHALEQVNTNGSYVWPGDALTTSTASYRVDLKPFLRVLFARVVVVWTPRSTASGILISTFTDGPANMLTIGEILGTNVDTPVVSSAEITTAMNTMIDAAPSVQRHIGYQTKAGTLGFIAHSIRIETVWTA